MVAREEERRRVGRDLHDGLGPQLASLTMKAEAARELIDGNPHRAGQLLSELLEQTEHAVEDVRRVAHQLRPPVLDALGLLAALRVHGEGQQPTPVHLDLPQGLPPLTAAVEVAAYHIALEALRNVASHAGATRCTLRLHQQGPTLHLEVADDGSGIPVTTASVWGWHRCVNGPPSWAAPVPSRSLRAAAPSSEPCYPAPPTPLASGRGA